MSCHRVAKILKAKLRWTKMKEREKLRIWESARGNQIRISDLGRLELDCQLDEWKMEDEQSKVQKDGAKDEEHAGQNRHSHHGRQRFKERGGENIECLILQKIWN